MHAETSFITCIHRTIFFKREKKQNIRNRMRWVKKAVLLYCVVVLCALLVIMISSSDAVEVDGCKLCCDHQFRGHCKCCSPHQLEELAILGGGSSKVDVGEVDGKSAGGGGGCNRKCCHNGHCGCCSPHQLEDLATRGGGGRGGGRGGNSGGRKGGSGGGGGGGI